MNVGDIVQVTAGRLGGYDNVEMNGRPTDDYVTTGWLGEVVWPLPDIEPGEWWLASFAIADGKTLYVPVVEPDHVTIFEKFGEPVDKEVQS